MTREELLAETILFSWLTLWFGGMMLVATIMVALLV